MNRNLTALIVCSSLSCNNQQTAPATPEVFIESSGYNVEINETVDETIYDAPIDKIANRVARRLREMLVPEPDGSPQKPQELQH